jgi:hypothetical protein
MERADRSGAGARCRSLERRSICNAACCRREGGHTVLAELPIERSAGDDRALRVRFWDLDDDRELSGISLEPGAESFSSTQQYLALSLCRVSSLKKAVLQDPGRTSK